MAHIETDFNTTTDKTQGQVNRKWRIIKSLVLIGFCLFKCQYLIQNTFRAISKLIKKLNIKNLINSFIVDGNVIKPNALKREGKEERVVRSTNMVLNIKTSVSNILMTK